MIQDILQTIRERDHLHNKQKKSGKPKDREAFLKHKHLVQQKPKKTAHGEYLENLLGLGQTTVDDPDSNKSKRSPQKAVFLHQKHSAGLLWDCSTEEGPPPTYLQQGKSRYFKPAISVRLYTKVTSHHLNAALQKPVTKPR